MGEASAPLPYAVNPLPFLGKVITVTGASRGLGLALSKYLLVRGARVSMCAYQQRWHKHSAFRTWPQSVQFMTERYRGYLCPQYMSSTVP
jgi:hypothetical protein